MSIFFKKMRSGSGEFRILGPVPVPDFSDNLKIAIKKFQIF
jgi:hypothetical protein